MLLQIRVRVGQVDLAVRAEVGERVEHVRDLGRGEVGRLVVAAVDAPVCVLELVEMGHGGVFLRLGRRVYQLVK